MTPAKVLLIPTNDEGAVLQCAMCGYVFIEDDPSVGGSGVAVMSEIGQLMVSHAHAHDVYDQRQPG